MSKTQHRYGDPIESIMDDAWSEYLNVAKPTEGAVESARRKAAFYAGLSAGLELARCFGQMLHGVGQREHARTAREFRETRERSKAKP